MAFDKAILKNPQTGSIKEAPMGYSWTMLIFALWPPLFRGDWKWVGIVIVTALFAGFVGVTAIALIPPIVGSFIWNKSYLEEALRSGYLLCGTASGDLEAVDRYLGYRVNKWEGA